MNYLYHVNQPELFEWNIFIEAAILFSLFFAPAEFIKDQYRGT